jgi:cytochrome bd-type quinol oxidase subunit 1
MQFWERLRLRFTTLHRVTGSIYVAGALILATLGAYIQFLDEAAQSATRSFTIAATVDAILLMTTTVIGLLFALKKMFACRPRNPARLRAARDSMIVIFD